MKISPQTVMILESRLTPRNVDGEFCLYRGLAARDSSDHVRSSFAPLAGSPIFRALIDALSIPVIGADRGIPAIRQEIPFRPFPRSGLTDRVLSGFAIIQFGRLARTHRLSGGGSWKRAGQGDRLDYSQHSQLRFLRQVLPFH